MWQHIGHARRACPSRGPHAPYIAGRHPVDDPSASGTTSWPYWPTRSPCHPASSPAPLRSSATYGRPEGQGAQPRSLPRFQHPRWGAGRLPAAIHPAAGRARPAAVDFMLVVRRSRRARGAANAPHAKPAEALTHATGRNTPQQIRPRHVAEPLLVNCRGPSVVRSRSWSSATLGEPRSGRYHDEAHCASHRHNAAA